MREIYWDMVGHNGMGYVYSILSILYILCIYIYLFSMYILYVYIICIYYMYILYVYIICIYILCIYIYYMYILYVYIICIYYMYIYIHTHTYIQTIIVNEHGRQPDLSTTWQLLQELDATLRCHQTQLEDPL